MTLFQRIVAGEIPAQIVYEDDVILAFHDIAPQAPLHILIIPKRLISRLAEAHNEDEELLGRLLLTARDIAKAQGVDQSGYRLIINNGRDGGEEVPHLHIHLLAGRRLKWPPG